MSKRILTTDEAISLLVKAPSIHAFVSPSDGVLVGADWAREDVEKCLTDCPSELSGPSAKSMNHGLAAFKKYVGYIFFETDPVALKEFDKQEEK